MSWTVTEKLLLSSLLPTESSRAYGQELLAAHAAEIDWTAFAQRVETGKLTPLVRFNLAQMNALGSLPSELSARLAVESQLWAARHLAYVSEAARLSEALAAAGIEAIPLKGAALMLANYYPQPGLRAALDIDLLVAPARLKEAERVAEWCGYEEIPGRTKARVRQRLPNELNHAAPRRGPSGLILELHHRAFHFAAGGRDFTFATMRQKAAWRETAAGVAVLLPAAADLALHLLHHTAVDLGSTEALLRTLADLHFIFAREPRARADWRARAQQLGFGGAATAADEAEQLLAAADFNEAALHKERAGCMLLLDTALNEDPLALAQTARLFEYLDLTRRPLHKLGNLLALVFTSRAHLEQLHGTDGNVYLQYWRRPGELLQKFNWAGLRPEHLRRVWRLRKLAARGF